MNIVRLTKSAVNQVIRTLGWELHRIPGNHLKTANPPSVFDDPLEALLMRKAGQEAAFECPAKHCRAGQGFGFGELHWHPFTEVLKQYEKNPGLLYEDSILKNYYDSWQPECAAEAFAGFVRAPYGLSQLPAHCFLLQPWKSGTPEALAGKITRWTTKDNKEHGQPELDWKKHGLKSFGPVSELKGKFEFNRLTDIYELLKMNGYDRQYGDIGVMIIRHNNDYRFMMSGGGYHRAAAMAALGIERFPAQYLVPCFEADTKDVDHWPQVRSGLWSADAAVAYVEHLFDFDSYSWARNMGLNVS